LSSQRTIIVYDLETSGLRVKDGCEIVQLAAKAINYFNFEDHAAGEFCVLLKPQRPEKAHAKAIEVIGKDLWNRALTEGVEPKVGLAHFMEWVNSANDKKKNFTKPILAGHHTWFDYDFLHETLEEKGMCDNRDDMPWQQHKAIDTWMLSWALFEGDRDVNSLTLDAMAEFCDIKRTSGVHDALEDVRITTSVLRRYMKFLRECRRRMKKV